ncbi:MAG: ATP-binding cassette domain-containing protein [Bilophila sp.]
MRGLRFGYPGGPLLFEDAEASVPPGVTALIGGNGVGKTTLARLLVGLNKAQAGSFFRRRAGNPASGPARPGGYRASERDHQLHMKTVRQELEVSLSLAPRSGENISGLLSLFALEGLAERHPQSLSGGEERAAGHRVRLREGAGRAPHPRRAHQRP